MKKVISRKTLIVHPYKFHLEWVMECLVYIQSSIITLQYHFAIHKKLPPSPLNVVRDGRSDQSINQPSFILLIISSFESTVYLCNIKESDPIVIDWSWVRSHSSFIQSFSLSKATLWQFRNEEHPISIVMREGRYEILNVFSSHPMLPWITIDSTELEICFIWYVSDLHSTDGWRDNKCSEGLTRLFLVM